jgi:hypothetical protein
MVDRIWGERIGLCVFSGSEFDFILGADSVFGCDDEMKIAMIHCDRKKGRDYRIILSM